MIVSQPPPRFDNLGEIRGKKYNMFEKQECESVTDQPLVPGRRSGRGKKRRN